MLISDVSIRRPVFTTMIMLAIAAFGAIFYQRLAVDLFPDVDFPVVTVTTIYAGADPETMETKVSDVIEEELNSLAGIDSLTSTNLESVSMVIVQFKLGVNLDVAAQDVRDRVSGVLRDLPDEAEQPVVEKLDLGAAPIMQLAVYGNIDNVELSRWVEDEAKPAIERVNGVGTLTLVGGREREVNVWIKPEKLRALGLTILDVNQALAAQNLDVPGGRIADTYMERTLRTTAEAKTVAELGNTVIATMGDTIVRLRDIADIEDGLEEERSRALLDGAPAIAIVVRKQSGENTVAVADGIQQELVRLREIAPAGVSIEVVQDNSINIRGSLDAVQFDMLLGAVLAVLIILFFLRDWRATLISATALPVSVLGTFVFVGIMGFSLNMMTTLALTLSIGILIDDAIVVIENIVRRKQELGESPFDAAERGTAEIGLAVLATTMSIVAVFVPVAFMDGMVGQFFFEFGLTVAVAVMISMFVSFTLTPMLSARFLSEHEVSTRGISGLIERLLTWMDTTYRKFIEMALRFWYVTILVAILTLGGTMFFSQYMSTEFMPVEDRNQFAVKLELPSGAALQTTADYAEQMAEEIRALPGVETTFVTVGGGVEEKVNTAVITVNLVHRSERTYHQYEMMNVARNRFADRQDATISVEQVSAMAGGARQEPLQIGLGGNDLDELGAVAARIMARMGEVDGIVDIDSSYRPGKPEYNVAVDRSRAADAGIFGAHIGATVRAMVSGEVATTLSTDGDRIDVRVQLPVDERASIQAISTAQVRSSTTGQLLEVRQLAEIHETSGPTQIDRKSRQRQVVVYANLDGLALGDAMAIVNKIAAEEAPSHINVTEEGNSKELAKTTENMVFALFLAVLCIYMILASQFESFAHPFTIMVSLPFSLIGAIGALLLSGETMSIFAMIGVIMLMGLVTKNAILLVDYATQLRAKGYAVRDALIEAGAVRLRPILMTTAAMVFGMIPIAIGHGDGGEVRAPMGIVVIGGLISSTILTLIVVPAVYLGVEGMINLTGRFVRRIGAVLGIEPKPVEHPFDDDDDDDFDGEEMPDRA